MADTKWLDISGWTLLDWEDDTKTVLVDFLWSTLKGAADERQAYCERTHSAGFDSDYSFPNFSELKRLINTEAYAYNAIDRIDRAIYPYVLAGNSALETSTIKVDGTPIATSEANNLSLFELLDEVLGYPSGALLSGIDTGGGRVNGIVRMSWIVQWYQVLTYPRYILEPFRPLFGTSFFSVVETQELYMQVSYDYIPSSSIAAASASLEVNGVSAGSRYTPGSLNFSSPYSTSQEVYDYAYTVLNDQKSTEAWELTTTNPDLEISQQVFYQLEREALGTHFYQINIREKRIRFKVNESFRALSPEKYTTPIHKYFYLTEIDGVVGGRSAVFNAFGGPAQDSSKFTSMTQEADGYYYLNTVADYSTFPVPADPIEEDIIQTREGNDFQTLDNSFLWGVISEPNTIDGTNFEYYTP
jgi:hypothetical protein